MKKLADQPVEINTLILAGIFDFLRLSVWALSSNSRSNRNCPMSLLEELGGKGKVAKSTGYSSGEEFKEARKVLLEKIAKEGGKQ